MACVVLVPTILVVIRSIILIIFTFLFESIGSTA